MQNGYKHNRMRDMFLHDASRVTDFIKPQGSGYQANDDHDNVVGVVGFTQIDQQCQAAARQKMGGSQG